MLKITKLTKQYGSTRVVDELDLQVEVGQIHGLLGPNGAGKSTTLKMICGVLFPTAGLIEIAGINLHLDSIQAKKHIGYVPEGAPLPVELYPIEFFRAVARLYGLNDSKASLSRVINHWAERCEIVEILSQPIGTLSRGYKQRVALVAALLHNPSLLILDEPSTGLDPAQHVLFRELIKELAKDKAILYSSHHLSEVEATCDFVTVLCSGQVIAEGSFDEIARQSLESIAEVSPHNIATSLNAISYEPIDSDWMRITIAENECECIANKVIQAGGTIRLLRPQSETLESAYLRLIEKSGVS